MAALVPGMVRANTGNKMIWGNLLHLSMNMWEDWDAPGKEMRSYYPYLRFDEKLWNDLLKRLESRNLNMVVWIWETV